VRGFRLGPSASGLVVATSIAIVTTPARADSEPPAGGADPAPERLLQGFAAADRPMGIAEGSVGVLTLPRAEVCAERSQGCSKGDVSFAIEVWQLYRFNQRFAFGAGVVLGLIPTASPRQDPEVVERDHSRSYLTLEGSLRYYPFVGESLEAWVGVVGGGVVVNDSFQVVETTEDDRALLGNQGVTIRTEGGTLGAATGFAYRLTDHFSFGGTLRYTTWFLPNEPATDPLGSEASLTGINSVLSLAFGLAYRVPL